MLEHPRGGLLSDALTSLSVKALMCCCMRVQCQDVWANCAGGHTAAKRCTPRRRTLNKPHLICFPASQERCMAQWLLRRHHMARVMVECGPCRQLF